MGLDYDDLRTGGRVASVECGQEGVAVVDAYSVGPGCRAVHTGVFEFLTQQVWVDEVYRVLGVLLCMTHSYLDAPRGAIAGSSISATAWAKPCLPCKLKRRRL